MSGGVWIVSVSVWWCLDHILGCSCNQATYQEGKTALEEGTLCQSQIQSQRTGYWVVAAPPPPLLCPPLPFFELILTNYAFSHVQL